MANVSAVFKIELMHNETCRISRLEIVSETLMKFSSSLIKLSTTGKYFRVKVSVRGSENRDKVACNFEKHVKQNKRVQQGDLNSH